MIFCNEILFLSSSDCVWRKGRERDQSQTICEGCILLVICMYVDIIVYVSWVFSCTKKHFCPSGLRSSTEVRMYASLWVQIPQDAIFFTFLPGTHYISFDLIWMFTAVTQNSKQSSINRRHITKFTQKNGDLCIGNLQTFL